MPLYPAESLPVEIPLFSIASENVTLTFDVPNSDDVTNITVGVWIEHPSVEDLGINLWSPDEGAILDVSLQNSFKPEFASGEDLGTSGVNLTVFDDAGGVFSGGSAPYVGSFQPSDYPDYTLNDFDGNDPVGIWTLFIYDFGATGGGMARTIALNITPEPPVDPPLVLTDAGGIATAEAFGRPRLLRASPAGVFMRNRFSDGAGILADYEFQFNHTDET